MASYGGQQDFAVSAFMSKVDKLGGLVRKNRFSVEITPPNSLSSEIQASSINFLAKTISFPARAFGSTTYRSGGRFGLEVPYETTFEPVSLTILDTGNHAARKFWNGWFEHIQGVDAATGQNYNMQYYKKFVGTVKISTYSEEQPIKTAPKYQITLHQAWPKTISAIELGWENSELADFDIDIAYSKWTETT